MTKTMIAPIISVIFLLIKGIFNIDLGSDLEARVVDIIVSLVFVVSAIHGIYVNHKKEEVK